MLRHCLLLIALSFTACDGGTTPPGGDRDAGVALPPGEGCNSVRLTNYETSGGGWCGFPHGLDVLPAFVREEGLTTAIAEPFAGGSYDGEVGEACGECWEIDTLTDTRVVMVTDLCPNDGNPLCQGSHFHLDISRQASEVLEAGFLDEAQARRVPCPVEGNVHVFIADENFSYLRLSFVNHRVPIRSASVRASAPGSPELPLVRAGGQWEARGDDPLDGGGEGVIFTITSAQGQTLESSVVVPAHPPRDSVFDLGLQFEDREPPVGGACEFVPPADVFVDDFGGIDRVRWQINPWGEAEEGFFGATTDGCLEGSCLQVERLGQYSGFHLFYRANFPPSTFRTFRMQARASAPTEIIVAPSSDGERCDEVSVPIGPEYTEVVIDVPAACGGFSLINAITVDHPGETVTLTLDDARFER